MLEVRIHNIENRPSKSQRVFHAAADLVMQILSVMGYDGTWTLAPDCQRRSKSGGRFKVTNFDRTTLKVRVKPSDNSSCWEYRLIPPSVEAIFILGRDLSLWNGWDGHETPDAVKANLGMTLEVSNESQEGHVEVRSQAGQVEPPRQSMEPVQIPATVPDVPVTATRGELDLQVNQAAEMLAHISAVKDRAEKHQLLEKQLQSAVGHLERLTAEVLEAEERVTKARKKLEADVEGKSAVQSLVALAGITQQFGGK